jgi:non-ribosomal peptide synthetase component F
METFNGAMFECTDLSVRQRWVQASIPIGLPSPNYAMFVVDHRMQLVPPGVVGELLIGVEGLTPEGYYDKPELSKGK